MPIYIYICKDCDSETKISHSMSETIEHCEACDATGTLVRMPSMFLHIKETSKQETTAASRVKEFIEEAKDDLSEQKKILRDKND